MVIAGLIAGPLEDARKTVLMRGPLALINFLILILGIRVGGQ